MLPYVTYTKTRTTLYMIDRQKVIDIAKQWLDTKEGYFLVDVDVTPDNRIVVEIDQAESLPAMPTPKSPQKTCSLS